VLFYGLSDFESYFWCLRELIQGSLPDILDSLEFIEQFSPSGRSNTWDFFQAGLQSLAGAPLAVGGDRKAMGLIAGPL